MNCNVIINNWHNQLEKYFHHIKNNIGNIISFTNKDRNCLSLGLQYTDYLIKYQKCHECDMISRFLNEEILLSSDEIEIKFGKYKGDKINFQRYDYQPFEIKATIQEAKINKNISKKINEIIIDNSITENIYYYNIKNKYLNLSLVNTILFTIGKAKNFPNKVLFLNFYHCRDKIIMLRLNYDIEYLKELLNNPLFFTQMSPTAKKKKDNCLTANIVEDIWKQLIIYFLFYENFYFTHNEADISFLKINSELNNFIFEEKEYISPIKLYILPSVYSAISIYNSEKNNWARIFYGKKEDRHADHLIDKWHLSWQEEKRNNRSLLADSIDIFTAGQILYYHLGPQADKFLYYRRHFGTMIMYQSFDILCFLTSLMIEKYIYESVKNNSKLNKVWQGLWLSEEINDLEEDIRKCKKNNFDNVFNILRKYHLRSDILEYMKNKLIK